jgi:AcrR family transcriptional regulator
MATPRLTREARREAILDAATEVFGRLGFETTRMEDVAKAAGIAKGLLYKHFSSKDALFQALIDRQAKAYASELSGALAGADLGADPLGALREGLAFWLRKMGDEAATFHVTDPGVHDAYDSLRSSLREVIAEAIRRYEPQVPEPSARLVAALLQGAAESLGLVWRDDPGPIGAEEALGLLTAFCWGGLRELGAARRTGADSARPPHRGSGPRGARRERPTSA